MRIVAVLLLLLCMVQAVNAQTPEIDRVRSTIAKVKAEHIEASKVVLAQSRQAEIEKSAPPVYAPDVKVSAYVDACRTAAAENRPLVVFVGQDAFDGLHINARFVKGSPPGTIYVSVKSLTGFPEKCVLICEPDGDGWVQWKAKLPADATDAQIVAAIGRKNNQAVSQPTDGPWLSRVESDAIRAMWPDGVPSKDRVKLYNLRPAGQSVAAFGTPGAGNHYRFMPASMGAINANREFPWIGSGGMDFAEKGTWRNVTGMDLPDGAKIKVWLAPMLVSTQYETAMHWEFPVGTKMFDVLIRKNADGSEHIFNVRMREKLSATTWSDGASFFPDVPVGEVHTYSTPGNDRSRNVLGVDSISYRVAGIKPLRAKKYRFKESNVAIEDGGHFFPPGFKGNGLTCNKCHSGSVHEARTYGGVLLRGKDTVFSWHPVPESLVVDGDQLESGLFAAVYTPRVDKRWPIELAQ